MNSHNSNSLNLLFFYVIPLLSIIIIAFIFISIYINLPYNLSFSFNKDGFDTFVKIFKIPLTLLWKFILAYGLIIALYRLSIAEKQLKLNQQAFIEDFRPFVILKKFDYNKSSKKFEFSLTNFGRHLARIISVHLDYKEPQKKRMATFNSNYFVILKDEIKNTDIQLSSTTAKIVERWYLNGDKVKVHITILYFGFKRMIFKTKEVWTLNPQNGRFEITYSEWT